jgi:hypothetical protein
MTRKRILGWALIVLFGQGFAGCAMTKDIYRDSNMDFGQLQTVAVMPFNNLSRENFATERVRDVFITMLLATGDVYVLPPGEVNRGINRAEMLNPQVPTPEEVVRFCKGIKADAVFIGTIREYGDVRSGASIATVISMSLQMMEAQTGKTVWSASTTKGGIGISERLFGGGGEPMNVVTEKAINELLDKLFK